MKSSVSLWSLQKMLFGGQLNVIEAIEKLHNMGADAVELLDCFPMKFPATREKIKELGMTVSSFSVSNNFFCQPEKLADEIATVKFGIDAAVFFGAKSVRVFIGYDDKTRTYDELMNQAIGAFQSLMPYAEQNGVFLSLENHGLFAGKSQQVKDIIKAVGSPNMKANVDTGNFKLVDEDPATAIANLAGDVGFVHFKDVKEMPEKVQYDSIAGVHYQGTVIGEGEVELEKITGILKDMGYDGYLSIEYEGLEEDNIYAVAKSVAYTNTLL